MAIPVLPLDEMSVEEKLQTMEAVWESLSANPEAIESPAWHEEELRVREARVASWRSEIRRLGKGERGNSPPDFVRMSYDGRESVVSGRFQTAACWVLAVRAS